MLASFLNISSQTLLHRAGLLPSAALIASLIFVFRRARGSMWLLALLSLPGTFAHELLHFIVGTLLLAKPVGFSVRPKSSPEGWTLGSVSFQKINIFNGVFVGLAPFFLLPLAWLCLAHLAIPLWRNHQWGGWIAASYLTSTLLFAALPSRQDLKLAGPSLFLYGTLGGLWWLWGAPAWQAWFPWFQ